MKTTRLITTLLTAGLITASVHADVFPPVQDSYSLRGNLTLATGKAGTLSVTATRKAFVQFDLTNLPADVLATDIASARLRIYFPKVAKPGDIDVSTVTQAWSEAAPALEPTFSGAPVAKFLAATVLGRKFAEVDVTATVQGWYTTPASNFGFALTASGLTNVLIGSKEGSGSGYPCELEVEVDRTTSALALALPGLTTRASQNGPTFLSFDVLGGSTVNTIAQGVTGAVIAGGGATNGFPQQISANYSVIGGGYSNTVTANGSQSTIAGGVGNTASNFNATIGGGGGNIASGSGATVPGGTSNTAGGSTSFAAGNRAKAVNIGSFVWGDSTNADVSSTANDQFTVRANGGMVLNTPSITLPNASVTLSAAGDLALTTPNGSVSLTTTGNVALNATTGVALSINATNVAVTPGTLYRDNTIVAWGHILGSTGAVVDAFNATATRNSAGNYTITLSAGLAGGHFMAVATPTFVIGAQPTTAATMRFATVNQLFSATQFNVFINSGTFAATDNDFTFIVMGR